MKLSEHGMGGAYTSLFGMEFWGLCCQKILEICILTAIKSLVLADDWMYSGRGYPKHFASVLYKSYGGGRHRSWREVGSTPNLPHCLTTE